jgi:pimeloyl-ACP methyl ester carboxylesterase
MESLFFGPSSAPLYGVYCPARPDRERGEGIVFCYPFGQEYMRAHRPIRQLSLALSEMGYHVLRFDYHGSGDSCGTMQGVDASDWIADIGLAVEELRDMAAVQKISIIGLRLGGLMAALAACDLGKINRLVLWDPVTSGAAYVDELKQDLPVLPMDAAQSNFIEADQCIHINGFSMPTRFQQGLQELAMTTLDTRSIKSVLQLVSHESPGFAELKQAWSGQSNFNYQLHPAPHDWNYVDNFGSILLPQPIMNAIKSWFN